jgi:hypothetical protein
MKESRKALCKIYVVEALNVAFMEGVEYRKSKEPWQPSPYFFRDDLPDEQQTWLCKAWNEGYSQGLIYRDTPEDPTPEEMLPEAIAAE